MPYEGCHGLLAVELAFNRSRDRPDLRSKLGLNAVEIVPVVKGDKVDSETKVAKAPGTADAVEVRFRRLGEIEVDHNVDGLYVNAACEQI
jgi:hypothetical protein